MKFMMRAELTDVTSSSAVTWRPARGEAYDALRARAPRPARVVRRGRRSRRRPVGVRGAADRPRRAPVRRRHRRPHDPQRGRLDRLRRTHGQGLLPRPGDRRPGAHPRPAAAAADAAAPRREREPAAPGRRRPDARGEVGRVRRLVGPAPRGRARSRSRWSSGTSTWAPTSSSTACRPRRRSWSTPRSGCTFGRSAEAVPRRVTQLAGSPQWKTCGSGHSTPTGARALVRSHPPAEEQPPSRAVVKAGGTARGCPRRRG